MSQKINKNSLKLIIGNLFFRGSRLVFQIFLNIFLWKETGDISVIALFNLAYLSGHLLGFIAAAGIVKKGFSLLISRVTHVAFVLSYLFIILFPDIVLNYFFIWSAIFGVFNGIYYSNYNVLQFDLTRFKNRGNFEGIKKSFKVLGRAVFPPLFGLLIGLFSIDVALFLGIILFLISMYFNDIDAINKGGELQYRKFGKIVLKNKKVLLSIIGSFFFTAGFSLSLIEVLIPLIMFDVKPSELSLGLALAIVSIGSMLLMYLFGKHIQYKFYNHILPTLTILFVGTLFFLLNTKDYTLIVLLGMLLTTTMTLFAIPFSVITMNCLHSIKNYKDYRIEYNIFREIGQVSGWILSFGAMYFSSDLSTTGLQTLLYFLVFFAVIATLLLMKIKIHEIK